MKIALARITPEGVDFAHRACADDFDILKELLATGEVLSFSAIEIQAMVTARADYYDVDGRVSTRVGLACSRCLTPFTHTLNQRFSIRFSQQIPKDISSDEEADIELTADQVGLIFFDGKELDLKDPIQEQVVLALPYKPLCRPDCKGLCPKKAITYRAI